MIGSPGSSGSRITLLLTATIHPRSTIFVERSDPVVRLTDYRIALGRWLKESAIGRIVFCENSGAALDQLCFVAAQGSVYDQEIIFVSYTAPETDGARGKGYGELGILSHVLSCQILGDSDHILKVTGRYAIDNFDSILADIRRHWNADIITSVVHLGEPIPSECFYASVAFLDQYLLAKRELINDVDGFYFEHALAQSMVEAIGNGAVHAEFTDLPRISGVSGTSNLPWGIRSSPVGIELALTPDYVAFLRARLVEFCQYVENDVDGVGQSDAAGLLAKVAAFASAISPPVMANVMFTYAELRVLRASIEVSLREPAGFAGRTGFSVEVATDLVGAIGHILAHAC